jgi:hypothetical protein
VRDALGSLQFVEKGSIEADVITKDVSFRLKAASKLDLQKVKDALAKKGFDEVEVVSQPK